MALQIITANRLLDGEVVYFGENAEWIENVSGAMTVEDADGEASLLAAAKTAEASQKIVGAYLMKVKRDASGIHTLSVKEEIRAKGPTVRYDLGKQAR
ncbi:DUF2849 domain-containing protein [Kiloniella laminariae]|uniref:DUF2849 domain-containing protein n=1 Tax=Kiloniella laminariae TaxID=454162 RepID=A0ABT4LLD4_9PROT|nr:DUF2849 domain-containing protein [Kiloniella laminariae]MCZ4281918.1 DUF2849 domain-containing protein [Kiloniella laminariae]